jgi:hypothetical protein
MFFKFLLLIQFLPCLVFAQLKGESTHESWGGYWWSMKSAETVLGWENQSTRKIWSPQEISVFTKCLSSWTKACDKFKADKSQALSPLMKFDLYIYKKLESLYGKGNIPTTQLTKTSENELKIHYIAGPEHPHYEASGYAGKCNGWSLSTFFHREPTKEKLLNGILFTPADIKAILAVKYNASQFFVPDEWAIGEPVRADMSPEEYKKARHDVKPHDFIKALQQTIGIQKMPLLADLDPEDGVWNYPVFAYEIKIIKKTATSLEGILKIKYADDQAGEIDDVYSTLANRTDHKTRDLPFKATLPASWKDDFSKIKNSQWLREAKETHPDTLVLGIEKDWIKSIKQYRNTDMKLEVNFQLLKNVDFGNGWELAVDHLINEYY